VTVTDSPTTDGSGLSALIAVVVFAGFTVCDRLSLSPV